MNNVSKCVMFETLFHSFWTSLIFQVLLQMTVIFSHFRTNLTKDFIFFWPQFSSFQPGEGVRLQGLIPHGHQVAVVLQRHVPVQVLLIGGQELPLLPREVHGHILQGQGSQKSPGPWSLSSVSRKWPKTSTSPEALLELP